ncbi:MAG TPA: CRTAC1 family protein, partial [Methylomirabilota bacterium]|nr:CRTAC1 family protein [Methylomirabilota bacterium]
SRPGPGVAWVDLDGDGWDDLVVTAGRGGQLGVFMNQSGTGFKPHEEAASFASSGGEQTAAVGVASPDGSAALVIGLSNYEDGTAMESALMVSKGAAGWELDVPDQAFTAGPLVLADVDGDGDLDLFIGGRCLPGRFPEPAPSLLLRNENGRFRPDTENTAVFERVGMVQGAVFSDIDGDGDPDLIVACDWGPVRLFINEGGRFTEQTAKFGLEEFRGRWNGVATGDFDGDGRMDIVASNLGRNSMYESHRERPLRLYHADLNRDGRVEVLMAWYETSMSNWIPVHGFDAVAAVLPPVRSQFATYEEFGRATIADVLGPWLPLTRVEEVSVVESSIFLNRGDHFERRPLPVEAQLAPAFGIAVGDLNGDGHEDLFLSQNFFATRPEVPRYDAGRGLVLLGDGRGNFRAMPGQQSGLRIYGEQRGCALSDFDADGRLDLVVGQNAAATKLYRNVGATPGLRVRLRGQRHNPDAVGAQLRPIYKNTERGAAREIQAGSGYWSQNSTVQVFGRAEQISRMAVRWPQGSVTAAEVPAGALEIVVKLNGGVEVIR